GWLFFTRDYGFVAQRLDLTSLRLTGDPVTVAPIVGSTFILGAGTISASADGAVAFRPYVAPETEMTWTSRAGDAIGAAVTHGVIRDPNLSPDGRRLAFVTWNPQRQNALWVRDIGRQTSMTIATDLGLTRPIWSPDSQRITFGANNGPGGNLNLYD